MEENEKKQLSFLVLTYDDFQIWREPYSYMVMKTKIDEKTGERRRIAGHETYHIKLADAISELSRRMFSKKLNKREKAKMDDLESLVRLAEDHKAEIGRIFGSL